MKLSAARLHRKLENINWRLAPTFPIIFTLLDSSKNDLQDCSMLIYVMKYRYNHPHLLWHCLVNKRKTLIAGLLLDANKSSCHMTKQSLFYISFTVPGQVKCFNKMYRGHRGQLFMNKHKWYLIKIIMYAVWRNLLLQCVVTIFCIDLSSSDMFTGSFTTPREETVFGSVKSTCCLFANEERNQEKDSWKV